MPAPALSILLTATNATGTAVAAAGRGLTTLGGIGVGAFKAVGLAAVAAGGAVAGFVYSLQATVSSLDEIGKASRAAGLTAEQFQVLSLFAERSGLNITQTQRAFRQFNRVLGEAAFGAGQFRRYADELGLTLQEADGTLRPTIDLLRDFTVSLQDVSSEAEVGAIANAAFGGSGIRLGFGLRAGIEAVDELEATMRRLGLIMGNQAVADAEAVGDSLALLVKVVQALRNQFLGGLLPGINAVALALADTLGPKVRAFGEDTEDSTETVTDFLGAIVQYSGDAIRGLGALASSADEIFGKIALAAGPVAEFIKNPAGPGATVALVAAIKEWDNVTKEAGATADRFNLVADNLDAAWDKLLANIDDPETQARLKAALARGGEDVVIPEITFVAPKAFNALEGQISQAVQSGFEDGSRGLLDFFNRFLLQRIYDGLATTIYNAIGSQLAGSFIGRILGFSVTGAGAGEGTPSVPTGERALGGGVYGGSSYLVGERGPELFVPKGTGEILPAGGFGGGPSLTVVNNIDAPTVADPAQIEELAARVSEATIESVRSLVYNGRL